MWHITSRRTLYGFLVLDIVVTVMLCILLISTLVRGDFSLWSVIFAVLIVIELLVLSSIRGMWHLRTFFVRVRSRLLQELAANGGTVHHDDTYQQVEVTRHGDIVKVLITASGVAIDVKLGRNTLSWECYTAAVIVHGSGDIPMWYTNSYENSSKGSMNILRLVASTIP